MNESENFDTPVIHHGTPRVSSVSAAEVAAGRLMEGDEVNNTFRAESFGPCAS